MDRYDVQECIGEGTFGTVFRAIKKDESKKVVAIKRIKRDLMEWDKARKHREFQAILSLSKSSKYIVQIFEIVLESNKLYFVCEYMPDGTLDDLVSLVKQQRQEQKTRDQETIMDRSLIKSILYQVLLGLKHIHSQGLIHRDLKLENILLRGGIGRNHNDQHCEVKVADFSLVRRVSLGPNSTKMTSYVATRWYRAPELLLCAPIYTTAIDMFALGCVMAELFLLSPLFPGSGEVEQLSLILKLLGPLEDADWPEGVQLSKKLDLQVKAPATPMRLGMTTNNVDRIAQTVPSGCPKAASFLASLLKLNPNHRPSSPDALSHEYFILKTPSHPSGVKIGLQSTKAITRTDSHQFEATTTMTTPVTDATTGAGHQHSSSRQTQNSRPPFVSVSPSMRNLQSSSQQEQNSQFTKLFPNGYGDSVLALNSSRLTSVGKYEQIKNSSKGFENILSIPQHKRRRLARPPAEAFL